MNKEQLTALGLDEEQIKEVFKLNGLAVTAVKDDLAVEVAKAADLKTKLEVANKEIKGFEDLNIEDIKLKSKDYEEKYNAAKLQAEKDIAKLKQEHLLDAVINKAKAKDAKDIKALIKDEDLEGKDEKHILGLIEEIKKEKEYLFEVEGGAGTGGSMGNGERKSGATKTTNYGAEIAKGKAKNVVDTSRFEL